MTPAQYNRHAELFDAVMRYGDSMLGLPMYGEVAAEALRRWAKERQIEDLLEEYVLTPVLGDPIPAVRVAKMIMVYSGLPASGPIIAEAEAT